ncbi:MAG: exonuclease SbcCD subunit D, partial [Chloroflexi bacterium]|nr:exonuclease SbcCD subunit D [Chloroflexota bacterium]
PWVSKRPVANPVEEALTGLAPARGVKRICMAHGVVDLFAPDPEASGVIRLAMLESAIHEEKVHFVALGDRHSLTKVGAGERVWYSGTPEATDFSETRSGFALIVDVDDRHVTTKEVRVGEWRFVERRRVDVNTGDDVEVLRQWLEGIEDKERTIVHVHLVGSVSLSLQGLLQNHLAVARDLLGALEVREDDLQVLPDNADFADLGFSGFADTTVQRLRGKIAEGRDGAVAARDALMLLLRLARGAA